MFKLERSPIISPTVVAIASLLVARTNEDDDNDNNDDSVRKLQRQANSIQVLLPWIEMYHRLVAYKKDHKDTEVPTRYGLDPQLGIWANNQRALNRKKKMMTKERKRLLNSVGFAWKLSTRNKAPWEEMYQRLVSYNKEHEHEELN